MGWDLYDSEGNKTGSVDGVQVGVSKPSVSTPQTALGQILDERDYVNQFAINTAERLWDRQDAMDELNRSYNSAEAQKLRDWQEYMSNSAYQRATVDMRKAGLNPILAVGSSASTPSGSSASYTSSARQIPSLNMNNYVDSYVRLVEELQSARYSVDKQTSTSSKNQLSQNLSNFGNTLLNMGAYMLKFLF